MIDLVSYEARVDRMLTKIADVERDARDFAKRYDIDAAEIVAVALDAFTRHVTRGIDGAKRGRAARARDAARSAAHEACRRRVMQRAA